MKIELYIDGEWKTFAAPFVPMLAKRKYLKVVAQNEKRMEDGTEISSEEIMEEEDELNGILVDVIFKNQFTLEQLYEGQTMEYIKKKFQDAIFGIPKEDDPGNEKGE